jgi:catechol 2,3-dioxygenase-like lactoylglutathione lyase family enzyme
VTERHVVVDHVLFVVGDLEVSRRFYRAALAPLGIEELITKDDGSQFGRQDLDDFAIFLGTPVTTAAHVAFDAASRDEVDAFHRQALAHGGRDNGEPGVWIQYSDRYYGAFVLDPDGNNVEAVFHAPQPIIDAPIRRPG